MITKNKIEKVLIDSIGVCWYYQSGRLRMFDNHKITLASMRRLSQLTYNPAYITTLSVYNHYERAIFIHEK